TPERLVPREPGEPPEAGADLAQFATVAGLALELVDPPEQPKLDKRAEQIDLGHELVERDLPPAEPRDRVADRLQAQRVDRRQTGADGDLGQLARLLRRQLD